MQPKQTTTEFFRAKLHESLKTSDRSHLEPLGRIIRFNPENCRTKDTSSILFDTMTFSAYCQKIQSENREAFKQQKLTQR